jgi:hypothetical protein
MNDQLENEWQRIKTYLEAEKRRINDEINQYPPPIPACDAQFNYLLEQRAGIAQEIQRMVAAHANSHEGAESAKLLLAFIQTSCFINDEARQSLIAGWC